MGMFAKPGKIIVRDLQIKSSVVNNGTPPSKIGNGPNPYRGLDEETQAKALAVTSHTQLASLGIEIISIPATPEEGFTMGSTKYNDEQLERKVKVSGFGLSKTPITNFQYQAYLGATNQDKADHPVVNVSWLDAIKFCNWLSIANGREAVYEIKADGTVEWDRTKKGFRLPTEAEWEYAARGLDGREYPWGDEPLDSTRANYWHEGSPKTTTSVGIYPAGAGPFGHMDLTGNVWEWCWDWYANYAARDTDNPIGPQTGTSRALRGGSWLLSNAAFLCCAYRFSPLPEIPYRYFGFRIAEDWG